MKIQGDVILKKGREASAKRFHPWIFSGAIQSTEGNPVNGDWVCVKDAGHGILGFGHYQAGSITVRLLSFSTQAPEDSFYEDKILAAKAMREASGVTNHATNCFRLVHGEGDGLPGLIIDMYGDAAVMQGHSAGAHADRLRISEGLKKVFGDRLSTVYYKDMAAPEGKAAGAYLHGAGTLPHRVEEHGHAFLVDWEAGQKTGFFLDQRENRRLVGTLSKGKHVLNTFCYTGGFSVYALRGGASLVHSIDASERAVEMAQKNIELNGFDPGTHSCITGDTFDFLKSAKSIYDVIILDPPAFAKHKEAKHQAMKGYQRLNAEAMRVIKSQGIIFTFSCSQVVDRKLFYDTVVSAAIQSGRDIQVLATLSQPADHPVSIYHPEGEYLKGLVLFVR
ncbi:MAG: class I SAM-dependent rRNA methyltransferase [Cytophagales bacterium]|nr:class I SAM-dependent rRNA methyltransferase [Cytophagales bacterium]